MADLADESNKAADTIKHTVRYLNPWGVELTLDRIEIVSIDPPYQSAEKARPVVDGPTEIAMGHGLVDVGEFRLGERRGVLLRPRENFIPVGDDGELQNVVYYPGSGDVVIWIDAPEGAQVIIDHLSPLAPTPPASEVENTIGAAELAVGQAVYKRIEALMDAKPGTPEGAELSYLADLVSSVEECGAWDGPRTAPLGEGLAEDVKLLTEALDDLDADNGEQADDGEQPVEEVEVNAAALRDVLSFVRSLSASPSPVD